MNREVKEYKCPLDLKRQINIAASGAPIQTVARFFSLPFSPRNVVIVISLFTRLIFFLEVSSATRRIVFDL